MNRFILTEEERKNISNLHKKFVNEEEEQATPVQPGVFNAKVQELQNHLITLGQKIVADGKLGPKTLAAAQTALQNKVSQPVTNPEVQPVTNPEVQPVTNQAVQPVQTTTPEVQTSDLNKYGLKPVKDYFPNTFTNNSIENKFGLTTKS